MTAQPVGGARRDASACLAGWLAALVLLPGFALSLITAIYGIDDLNTLIVFHSDEKRIVEQLLRNLRDDDLNPHGYFNYGYVYHAVGFWIARGYAAAGAQVDARFVAFLLRLVGLASFGLSLWVFVRLLGKLGVGPVLAAAATVLLGSLPSLVHFREFIHPDTLQLLFALLAIDALVQPRRLAEPLPPSAAPGQLGRTALAALWAGLAFGTKYSGVFVLAVVAGFVLIWLVAALALPAERSARLRSLGWGLGCALVAGGLFVAAWLLTNPYVLDQWTAVLEDVELERALLARGRGRVEPADAMRWFDLLLAELPARVLWGLFGAMLVAIGVAARGLFVPRERAGLERLRLWLVGRSGPEMLMLAGYCVLGGLHLYVTVNARRPQYLFHLIPVALALSALGAQAVLDRVPHRFAQRGLAAVLLVGAGHFALSALPASAAKTHKYAHPQLELGRWLAARYGQDTVLLADVYTYLPPGLRRTHVVRGVLQRHIDRFRPEVIVLNRAMSGRFNWKQKPRQSMASRRFRTTRADGAAAYRAFHDRLFQPDSPFRVVHETSDAVVLERKGPPPVPPG